MGFSNGYKSWANVYEKRSGEKYLETQFWFINEKSKIRREWIFQNIKQH